MPDSLYKNIERLLEVTYNRQLIIIENVSYK